MPAVTSILLATAAIGAGVAAYGAIKSADDQADVLQKDADLKNQQAQEVEREQGERTLEEGIDNQKTLGQIKAGYSESGLDLSGSNLYSLESTYADMSRQLAEQQKEADYKAAMIRAGASIESQQASDTQTAGYLSAAGGLIKSTGSLLSLTGGSSSQATQPAGLGGRPTTYSLLD